MLAAFFMTLSHEGTKFFLFRAKGAKEQGRKGAKKQRNKK
jgi:hypothetical protein